jgi:hypothetical protein
MFPAFNKNLTLSYVTGEFRASGLKSFNMVSLLALKGFILVNNFGESYFDAFFNPKIGDASLLCLLKMVFLLLDLCSF